MLTEKDFELTDDEAQRIARVEAMTAPERDMMEAHDPFGWLAYQDAKAKQSVAEQLAAATPAERENILRGIEATRARMDAEAAAFIAMIPGFPPPRG